MAKRHFPYPISKPRFKTASSVVQTIASGMPGWVITIVGQHEETGKIEMGHFGDPKVKEESQRLDNIEEAIQILRYTGHDRPDETPNSITEPLIVMLENPAPKLEEDADDDVDVDEIFLVTEELEEQVEFISGASDAQQDEFETAALLALEDNTTSLNWDSTPLAAEHPSFIRGKGFPAPPHSHPYTISQTPALKAFLRPATAFNQLDFTDDQESDTDEKQREAVGDASNIDDTDFPTPLKQPNWDEPGSGGSGDELGSPPDNGKAPMDSLTSWPGSEVDATGSGSPDSPPNELVTTDALHKYDLLYNKRYNLLICEPCASGLPLSQLYKHLKIPTNDTRGRMMWNEAHEKWTRTSIVFSHQASLQLISSKKKLVDEVVKSLIDAGHIKRQEEIRNDEDNGNTWKRYPLPKVPGQRPAVMGLRLFQKVFQCEICTEISPSIATMKRHYITTKNHGTARFIPMKPTTTAQTLTETGLVQYFQVEDIQLPEILPLVPEQDAERFQGATGLELVAGLLRRKKQYTMSTLSKMDSNVDVRTILPVYVRTGVNKFLEAFDRHLLQQPYERRKEDPIYKRLQAVVAASFRDDINTLKAQQLHHSILAQMTNCTPGAPTRFKPRSFAPLTEKKSVASYAAIEVKLIWTLLQATELGLAQHSIVLFHFSNEQREGLLKLLTLLKTDNFDAQSATEALYGVFDAVYFPRQPATGVSIFMEPVVVFLLLECLVDNGAYRSIFLIPPVIAKVQYAMRLRATHYFAQWFQELGSAANNNLVFSKCCQFSIQFLQDQNLAPFSTVRLWMHEFSIASKATPRAVLVWWKDHEITVGDVAINFPKYKAFLHQALSDTEKLVEEKVLLGLFTMGDLEAEFRISRLKELSPEDEVFGKGILLDGTSKGFDNPQSTTLFTRMLINGVLGLRLDERGDSFSMDIAACLIWLSDINKAMEHLMPLCHVLEGPPGRMTEESLIPLTNTIETSRGVVFEASEGTGGFRSGYHKGSHITGDHKDILRLIPYRIFALLYALIRLVRPIELMVLFEFVIKSEKRQATTNAYRERVFVSNGHAWDPTRMSKAIERFFEKGMGVKMGVRLFRHFAIAVQRHFPSTNYGLYETNKDERRLALVADLMAGHTTKVAEKHYARTESVVIGLVTRLDYIRICKDWHHLHGFSTSLESSTIK
ncbi:hypothetical protein BD779DRAFT_1680942 [Infundibulicybe gibba]|nr:hypothetical protein BD779DRAFT_1680942 [Infundibulicybe gibba]